MKAKKTFLTLAIVGLMAALLCFPASVFAKGPNSGTIPAGSKIIGPSVQGLLFLGWVAPTSYPEDDFGVVEAVLYLGSYTYYGVYAANVPLDRGDGGDGFMQRTPADITGGNLPCEIVEDFGVGSCSGPEIAVIWEEKDVMNFQTSWDTDSKLRLVTGPGFPIYMEGLSCEVKISFQVPK